VHKGGDEARRLLTSGYFGNPAGYDLESSKQYMEGRSRDFAGVIESVVQGKYQPPDSTLGIVL
jgi:hypothetical protein